MPKAETPIALRIGPVDASPTSMLPSSERAQYGGKSLHQVPSSRNARQKSRLADSSSSERSMSGT